ncbi:MAG TPA: hypothetical protein VMD75_03650, partial [Candidatus Binataceae bacterium]|nr:hypothetical protein [Candidatus Binataceae bacterium]
SLRTGEKFGDTQTSQQTRLAALKLVLLISTSFAMVSASEAQRFNGTPGAQDAMYFSNSKVLPAPALKFGGVIKRNAAQSKPWWPPRIVPPKARQTSC